MSNDIFQWGSYKYRRSFASAKIGMKQRIFLFMINLHALVNFPKVTLLMVNDLGPETSLSILSCYRLPDESPKLSLHFAHFLHFVSILFFYTLLPICLCFFFFTFSVLFLLFSISGTRMTWIDVYQTFFFIFRFRGIFLWGGGGGSFSKKCVLICERGFWQYYSP